ncbi:hypothetical protein GGR50DRAFT_692995 [Xylaria sp. CBS 124048]|nr:hypothetical protein GGR50DRAFT_692995 [Xylaria sp. CBS 124048]
MARQSTTMVPEHFVTVLMDDKNGCIKGTTFYTCGNFEGCCSADPCEWMYEAQPCDIAIAVAGGADGGNGDGDDGGSGGGDDGGSGGEDDGGDDDMSTSTTKTHLTPTTTETETDRESPTDDPMTTTDVDATPVPTATATSVTYFTGATNTGDETAIMTMTTTNGIPPATATPADATVAKATLSKVNMITISVGGSVGGIIVIGLMIWFIRRRLLSKRMSSIRGASPFVQDDKNPRAPSLTGTALGGDQDVFAEFGGRLPNPEPAPGIFTREARKNEAWHASVPPPMPTPATATSITATTVSTPATAATRPGPQPVQSQEQPLSSPEPILGRSVPAMNHPSPLTPGQPGTQMAIQRSLTTDASYFAPTRSTPTLNDGSVHDAQHSRGTQSLRGINHYSRESDYTRYAGQRRRAPDWEAPRANLNATPDERANNCYANSWAYGP